MVPALRRIARKTFSDTIGFMPAKASKIIVSVASNVGKPCPVCHEEQLDGKRFDEACQHLLSHGLKFLHVGQEGHRGMQRTVAVFGK